MNYEDYLKTSEWDAKRKARLALDGNRCRLCDEDGSRFQLEVHHRPGSYIKIPNESIENDLITLCVRCHDLITNAIREDRYGRKEPGEPSLIINNIQVRQEASYGMEKDKLSTDIVSPVDNAQRADGRSTKQVDQIDQTDFIQKKKDRL